MTEAAFPIVGIGASAGGVEALEGFFGGVPARPGLAFVVVTHLSAERESMLHQVVRHYTSLPVHIATDDMRVEVDCVYVMRADAILTIESGRLRLRGVGASRREPKPIDVFFSSLAADQGELAVGVVLSGGDGDGTLGIKAIKERGGLTLAQAHDGHGPQYPDMPQSAISTGLVDFAVPAAEMGARLAEFARSLHLPGPPERADDFEKARQEIYAILRNRIGHDFAGYKTRTFARRVQRRMQIRHIESLDGYVELLGQDQKEVGALFRDLLITVTNFFRDADAFQNLAAVVIPKLFEGRGAEDTVRVWVPGCATGEEVFSIGILLREHMDQLTAIPRVQIFGTDIDEHALATARFGRYPEAMLDGVSAERRGRFFVQDGASYIVAKEVRDLCIFSPHSVIRDPPFSRMDLVSCRNLLIYFATDVQSKVIPLFHYALRPDGYLLLGTSENVSRFGDLFAPIDKKHRIFRRREGGTPAVDLPIIIGKRLGEAAVEVSRKSPLGSTALRQFVEANVLERFAPPYVVVNGEGDVVFYSNRTGKYLEAAGGMPTRQILAIARRGLRLDLRAMLHEAIETGTAVTREGIRVEGDDGRVQPVALTIAPLSQRNGGDPLFLVVFNDQGPTLSQEEALARAPTTHDGNLVPLERELMETRERLQAVIEEYETALEELKSSNEELVSVNEELQSTNEELEASKEELQSVNEELHTVNADLSEKVDSLDRANSDLQNLFESSDVATIFLDADLRIRSFTPAVTQIFNILPGDRGRPITDLSSWLSLPDLAADIAEVFGGREAVERRIDHHKANYLVRVGPYRDGSQNIDGVVVTFVNVTSLTQAENRLRVLVAELQHRTRNLLTVAQAIVTQTLGKGAPVDAINARFAALGRVQGLVSHALDAEVELGEIVRLELQAHDVSDSRKISVEGPSVRLNFECIQAVALALHELTTNALKYGALKDGPGQLSVAWKVECNKGRLLLILDWRESGVAMPEGEQRQGYGRKLIEQALKFTLRARTELCFGKDGVSCRIEIPLAAPEIGQLPPAG
jgi:two-component system, chemotaxis family, CheB/CheR fusion protein